MTNRRLLLKRPMTSVVLSSASWERMTPLMSTVPPLITL
jgi:hypothetical protein